MSFQSTVGFNLTEGFVGELSFDGPTRARDWRLNDQSTIPNKIGRAYTATTEEGVGQIGGTGPFIGILGFPKEQALVGGSDGPLSPTLALPPKSVGSMVTMGFMTVELLTAASLGDDIYFVNATGELGAGTAAAGQTQIAGAKVDRSIPAPGKTKIRLTA
jgi:hypothetical protein